MGVALKKPKTRNAMDKIICKLFHREHWKIDYDGFVRWARCSKCKMG